MTSKYFKEKELSCKCGCGMLPEQELIDNLDALRLAMGEPIIINSCKRCAVHNLEVKGSMGSLHIAGLAVDIKVPNANYAYRILRNAIYLEFTGIGVGDNFIHLDMRPGFETAWNYGKEKA